MNNVSVYAAGGCGINVVHALEKQIATSNNNGFAKLQPYYVDTSKANLLDKNIPDEQLYMVENVDGSGKKRGTNAGVIAERCNEILHKLRPSDFNIVVHSTSGGSGAIIGGTLVSELLSRGKHVIVIMIASTDSRIEAQNTVNTLKSYEVISDKRDKPVVAIYYENNKDNHRSSNDSKVITDIVMLAMALSGENRELDSEDIKNFLDYTKVTNYQAGLTKLSIFYKDVKCERNQAVVSLMTLTDDNTSSTPNIHVGYQATGFIPNSVSTVCKVDLPIHFAVISGFFHESIQKLETRIKQIDEVHDAVVHKRIVSGRVESTDNGIVI